MELQEKGYSCGPAALRSVLYVYGKRVSEAAIRKWAGTTREGTDEVGLQRAMSHYGFRAREFQTTSVREATAWLKDNLRKGNPVLLATDKWDHWISVVGILGKKLLLFDPEPQQKGKRRKYSGVQVYSMNDLVSRWGFVNSKGFEDSDEVFTPPDGLVYYYGMTVLPEKD
jgi:ABC-type bacteriocin/lantibiotic exporter with double-glycine peptidase domain